MLSIFSSIRDKLMAPKPKAVNIAKIIEEVDTL